MSLAAACYTPTPANGAWTCSVGTHECPSGYYCAANDTCWKNDTKDGGAKTDAGGSGCAESTAPLCEDFESGSINAAIWSNGVMNGQVTVDSQHVHRGNFALHAHTSFVNNASLAAAQISTHKVFPALQDGFYARAFVYLSTPAPSVADTLMYVTRGQNGGVNLGFDTNKQGLQLYDIDTNHAEFSSTSMPLGTWVCLEWNMNGDSSKVWLDGNELHDLDYMGNANGSFNSIGFGTSLFQPNNQSPTDLWVDDIVVDTSQIGCTQ